MSLKYQLEKLIQSEGEVTYSRIKTLLENGYFNKPYRLSNAERRLRELSNIQAVLENGHIKSYRWIGAPQQVLPQYRYETIGETVHVFKS